MIPTSPNRFWRDLRKSISSNPVKSGKRDDSVLHASQHLSDYLRSHDHTALVQVVAKLSADLSAITTPQLLVLAQQTLN